MGRRDNQQQNTQTLGRRDRTQQASTTPTTASTPTGGNAFTNAPSNVAALFRGEISAGDVVKRMPGVALSGAKKTAEVVAPALTNFVKTTGGIIGEGAAYAIDSNVREQYRAGNLDILPNVTKTTQKGLLKDTAAAMLEATIIRSVPAAMKGTIGVRAGIGSLEGIGFAIAEGMAKDQKPDEIIKNATLYGVSGAALNAALPWLGPLLQKEIGKAPKTLVTALKEEAKTGVSSLPKVDIPPQDEATSVISYINKDNEKVYTKLTKSELDTLRDEVKMIPEPKKGESQIHLDANTDTLKSQGKLISRDEFISGHSQADGVIKSAGGTDAVSPQIGRRGANEVAVQGEQIPIGGPTKGASRLEARLIAQTEDPAYQSGASNYAKYSKAADAPEVTGATNVEQIKRAAKSVETLTPAQINDIVSGVAELPEGVLRTAFIKAAGEKALLEGNSSLVNRLARAAGQLARRFGQEIQFTKNFDPLDPVTNIADILSVRLKAAERRLPQSESVASYVTENVKKARKVTGEGQIKIKEAESLIDSILC